MATSLAELLEAIRSDFRSLDLQLAYADRLPDAQQSLANYVRLNVRIQQSPSDKELLTKRASHLLEHPQHWQWDEFLALRRVPEFDPLVQRIKSVDSGDSVQGHVNNPATESQIAQLEQHLGCHLPISFRAFLGSVANGLSWDDTGFLTTHQIAERTQSAREKNRLSERFPLDWEQMVGMYLSEVGSKPDAEFWEAGYADEQRFRLGERGLAGLLPIGFHDYGTYYVVLSGELRGVFWGTGVDADSYQQDLYHPEYFDLPEHVQSVPVPTISAILDTLRAIV